MNFLSCKDIRHGSLDAQANTVETVKRVWHCARFFLCVPWPTGTSVYGMFNGSSLTSPCLVALSNAHCHCPFFSFAKFKLLFNEIVHLLVIINIILMFWLLHYSIYLYFTLPQLHANHVLKRNQFHFSFSRYIRFHRYYRFLIHILFFCFYFKCCFFINCFKYCLG